MTSVDEAFKPLRDALQPRGTESVTMLRLKHGTGVDSQLLQSAIDEIIKHHTTAAPLGEAEPACMKLAKILLMDSAYLS